MSRTLAPALALAAVALLMGCRKDPQPATTTTTGATVPDVPVNTAHAKPDAGMTSAGIAVGGDPATGGGAPPEGFAATVPGPPQTHDGFFPQFGAKPPSADDAKHMPFGDEGMTGRTPGRTDSRDMSPSTQPPHGGHPHGGSAEVGNQSTGAGSSQSGGSQSGGSQGTAGARTGTTPTGGAESVGSGSQGGGQGGGGSVSGGGGQGGGGF